MKTAKKKNSCYSPGIALLEGTNIVRGREMLEIRPQLVGIQEAHEVTSNVNLG